MIRPKKGPFSPEGLNNPHSNGWCLAECDHCKEVHEEWEVEDVDSWLEGKIERKCLKCGCIVRPRYHQGMNAYCKYCYRTHNAWELGEDFGAQIVWVCLVCQHATCDIFMDIEKREE